MYGSRVIMENAVRMLNQESFTRARVDVMDMCRYKGDCL